VNISGATASSFTIASAQPSHAGSYDVIVSNSFGSVTSTAAALIVQTGVPGTFTNGSFEAGFTGWTTTGAAVVETASSVWVATDGSRAVAFNAGQSTPSGVVAQTFTTSVGQAYTLAFDAGAMSFLNTNVQRLEVTVQGSGTLLTQTITIAAPGNGTRYLPQSFQFVANSATTTLRFRDVSTTTINVDLMLDNVRVIPGAPAGGLTNGSFEADFTGWTATGDVQVVGADAIYVPTDGSRVVAFNPGAGAPTGVVSQTVVTTAGQGYTLTFDAGAMSFLNTNVQRLEVTVQGSSMLLTQTITIEAPGNGTRYLPQSFAFVANSAATTLTFRDVSTAWMNVDLMLDNVRVTTGAGLTNGSFENDSTGWTATGHQSIATGDPTRPASHGTKAVVLNPNDQVPDAVLSQTFLTTPGQRYSLAFDLGTVERIADQRIRVRVRGSATLLEQLLVVAGANAGPFYIPHQLAFVADSSSATLTFIDESFSYVAIDALLDNVRVTAESAQAPLITSPPQRAAAVQGGNATFGVGVSGTGPFSYQWQFNGVGIAGANNSTYTVVGASDASAGNYRVVVSNAQQSVTSSAATLTVLPTAILLNGSFEFGSAAWTFSNTSVATSTNTAHGVTDGTQLAHFNWGQQTPNGTLSQTFATTPGQPYVLAFDVGAESLVNQDQQRMQIIVQGISTRLSQSTSVTAPGNGTRYEPRSYVFTADSSMTTLTFQDTSLTTINVDLVLDNVRVTPQ
jgi:hypothetical protein